MKTYSALARINEAQEAREYDEELERRDREGERRGCVLGPSEFCRTCRLRFECEE